MSGDAPPPPPVTEVDWFRRYPNGGTVYARPAPVPPVSPSES